MEKQSTFHFTPRNLFHHFGTAAALIAAQASSPQRVAALATNDVGASGSARPPKNIPSGWNFIP